MNRWIAVALSALLSACAGTQFTADDGRKVDETLLAQIRAYGSGGQIIRPAIVRSAALKDPRLRAAVGTALCHGHGLRLGQGSAGWQEARPGQLHLGQRRALIR